MTFTQKQEFTGFLSVLAWLLLLSTPRSARKKFLFALLSPSHHTPLPGSFYFIFHWLEETGTSHEFNFCGCVYHEWWVQGTAMELKRCNPVPRQALENLFENSFFLFPQSNTCNTSNNFTEQLQSASLAQFYTADLKTWSSVRTLVALYTTHHNSSRMKVPLPASGARYHVRLTFAIRRISLTLSSALPWAATRWNRGTRATAAC